MIDNNKEYILCAAVHINDGVKWPSLPVNIKSGRVICGYRHSDCIATIIQLLYSYDERNIQGFLTSRDRFVDRHEAAKIAYEAGQIIAIESDTILISEDLYEG